MEFLTLLPVWYQLVLVSLLGLIVGSFLNVLMYRFNTGRSINGSSHCLSCATRLRWYELVPVVSYLGLRGRCQYCDSTIPFRYPLVEGATAMLFVVMYGVAISLPALLLGWVLAALLVSVILYDVYHLIIPDEFIIWLTVVSLVLVWWQPGHGPTALVDGALAAVGVAGVYWLLWQVSRGRWIGFGDVKLALPLGFLVGTQGAFSLFVLSFWVGAIVSIGLLLWQRLQQGKTRPQSSTRQLTMKSEVPFAPFMIIAFLLVFAFGANVLQWLTFSS